MKRKDFLEISGKSLLGASLLSQLPFNAYSQDGKTNRKNNGGTMIEVKTRRLFLQDTWTISRNSSDYKDNVFVKIEKDGIVGLGEAGPNVRYGENAEKTIERINRMKPVIEKANPWQFVDLKNEIFAGITDQNCARCALDIPSWIGLVKVLMYPYTKCGDWINPKHH